MYKTIDICWGKTKKNVENTIKQYIYYSLSVDLSSPSKIIDDYLLDEIKGIEDDKAYSNITKDEKKERILYINYFRFSFNKLTTEERKIIYWTYLDKEDNYDDRYIANSLGFSLGYYYLKKKETLIRFAYCLGVEEKNDR